MTTISSQILYHMILNQIGPILSSTLTGIYSSYLSHTKTTPSIPEMDDERELDLLQMNQLLKWMGLVFDDSMIPSDSHKAYKQELYNIYITIWSDYKQYEEWKLYNKGLWMFSSYRNKNTKGLAKKILSDIKLFKEGLEMFSMFERL